MPSSVYSTLFIEVGAVAPSAGYVVPAGYRAVMRDVCMFQNGSPDDTAAEIFNASTGITVVYHLFVSPFEAFFWNGHQVFDEGSEISAAASGPNYVTLRVSGYLLTLP